MTKETKTKLKKSTRKKLKWMVILLTSIATLFGVFTGNLFLFIVPSFSFWFYVILDKFNPLVNGTDMNKIVKKPKVKKTTIEGGKNNYDDSHERGY